MPVKLFEDLKDIPKKKTPKNINIIKSIKSFKSDLSEMKIGSKQSVDQKIQ